MYPNPFDDPYTGHSAGRCPICGSTGECPDAVTAAMPCPPVDLDGDPAPAGGVLRRYTVTQYGVTIVMRLNDFDAARYGDAAVLIT